MDITLLASAEIGLNHLWEKVYHQIHIGLVETKDAYNNITIGIAFPNYDASRQQLGNKLRLLAGTQQTIENFNASQRLSVLDDYVHLTKIRLVPDHIHGYAHFYRVQSKGSVAKLARRKAMRKNISFEKAESLLKDLPDQRIKEPFIWIKSHSSDERFPLFIGFESAAKSDKSNFNSYGLSRESSVPIFDH